MESTEKLFKTIIESIKYKPAEWAIAAEGYMVHQKSGLTVKLRQLTTQAEDLYQIIKPFELACPTSLDDSLTKVISEYKEKVINQLISVLDVGNQIKIVDSVKIPDDWAKKILD